MSDLPGRIPVVKFDDGSTWPKTYREMCEVIAADMEFRHKETGEVIKRTAKQVFEYSPTGELMQIPLWFESCVMWREFKSRIDGGEDEESVSADIIARLDRLIEVAHA